MWRAEIHVNLERSVCSPYGESRERFAETFEILKRAWDRALFSYRGKYYSFEKRRGIAEALSEAVARLSIAANSADTFPGIAELGHGVLFACGKARSKSWSRTSPPIKLPGRRWAIPASGSLRSPLPQRIAGEGHKVR
jgi:alkanesulfonate monooxygenase SsuD/methylene tetrahydromethanopterin reductase-like flavin-dependent oxidoreductase (luciferase family)